MEERFSLRKRLGGVFHASRLRGPLADDPTAQTLHAFLLCLALWLGTWSAILLPAYPHPPKRIIGAVVQILIPLGPLILLRLGFLLRASLFYLVLSWAFATYIVALNGGIRSPLLAYFLAVPIMASWLLGFQGALWSIVACASSTLTFALIDMAGVKLPQPYATPLGVWAVLMQVALTGAIPVAQILRALNAALQREKRHSVELQQRENALRESEERFRNMANTAPVKILVLDASRQAVFVNKTWLDFTGRPMEQELGQGWTAGMHPDDRGECVAELLASQPARVPFQLECRLRRADGEYRSILFRGVSRIRAGWSVCRLRGVGDRYHRPEASAGRPKTRKPGGVGQRNRARLQQFARGYSCRLGASALRRRGRVTGQGSTREHSVDRPCAHPRSCGN